MYKDIDLSETILKQFQSNFGEWLDRYEDRENEGIPPEALVPIDQSLIIDSFEVKVLTFGTWPVMQEQACTLPRELQIYKVRFEHWYNRCNGSRQLTWLYDNGLVELKILRGMNKSYHLTLKVFQAVVLLMFNQPRYAQDNATIKVIDIWNETNMSVDNFKQGMLKLCEPGKNFLNKSNPKKPTFNDNDTISLNLQFDNRSVRCNFIPSKTKKKVTLEPTADEVTMQKRIRKERAFVIQSKIVKIMKAHKRSTV